MEEKRLGNDETQIIENEKISCENLQVVAAELSAMGEEIGVSIKDDLTVMLSDSVGEETVCSVCGEELVCPNCGDEFTPANYIEIMNGVVAPISIDEIMYANGKKNYEVKFIIYNKNFYKEITVPLKAALKMEKIVQEASNGRICINTLEKNAGKKIDMLIKKSISSAPKIKKVAYIGMHKELSGVFVFGDEVITRDNTNFPYAILPHSSISEFSLLRDKNISEFEAIKFVSSNIIELSYENKFFGIELQIVRLLNLHMSQLAKFPEYPTFIKFVVGRSQSGKTTSSANIYQICGSKKNKVELNLVSTFAGVESIIQQYRDVGILLDDKAKTDDPELEKNMLKMINYFTRLFGDGTQRNKFNHESKKMESILLITAEELPKGVSLSTMSRWDVTYLEPKDINFEKLSNIRENPGTDGQFIYFYIQHILNLGENNTQKLYKIFTDFRNKLIERLPNAERRLLSNKAWLLAQYQEYLEYIEMKKAVPDIKVERLIQEYFEHCIKQIKHTMETISENEPLKKFFKGLYEEIRSGQAKVAEIFCGDKNQNLADIKLEKRKIGTKYEVAVPKDVVGFQQNSFYYILPRESLEVVVKNHQKNKSKFTHGIREIIDLMEINDMLTMDSSRRDMIGGGSINSKKSSRTVRIRVNCEEFRCLKIANEEFNKIAEVDDEYVDR